MTPETKARIVQLAARYNGGPGRIASKLDLFVGDVARFFDSQQFQDVRKVEEDKIIRWAMDHLQLIDIPYQSTLKQFRDSAHAAKIELARGICHRLDINRRWP
ncbi:MAG: hypothetical protein GXP38_05015 [Chloroflexi bacterium]|nr:hypothetical protein [Chloroflexota bacterium]